MLESLGGKRVNLYPTMTDLSSWGTGEDVPLENKDQGPHGTNSGNNMDWQGLPTAERLHADQPGVPPGEKGSALKQDCACKSRTQLAVFICLN